MHDLLIIGIPLLTILAGLFFNNRAISDLRSEIKDVRGEMKDLRLEMNARFNRVDDRLSDIYHIVGEHEGGIQAIERQQH